MTDPNMELVERTISYYYPPGVNDGDPIPQVTHSRCRVCNHPQRIFIENACFKGYSRKDIVARLDDPESLNWWNIKDHFENGHVPMHKQAVLDTVWKRAIEDGISPDDYEASQSTHKAALDLMVSKFYHQIKDPDVEIDSKDFLAAVRLQHQMESSSDGAFDPNDMYVALALFMNHVRTILIRYAPTELNNATADLQRLLAADPMLRKLSARMTKASEDTSVGMLDSEDDEIDDETAVEIERPGYIPLDSPDDFDEPDDEE